MGSLKLIDITFVSNRDDKDPEAILNAQRSSLAYIHYVSERLSITVVKHWRQNAVLKFGKALIYFFPGHNRIWFIPLQTIFFVKKCRPDIVLVQGFDSPWQVLLLRWALGRKTKMIVQHHGGLPGAYLKKKLQQWSGKYIDAFAFTAIGNAEPWIRSGIIRNKEQCYELLEASTFLVQRSKNESRAKLNIHAGEMFIWVGRLNENKDPLTVLRGFLAHVSHNPGSVLYMIYQTEELMESIVSLLAANPDLEKSVSLVGYVPHDVLADWYSAADFYISGSHNEGSGYALIEAMACGCIPVVTDIPSFHKITAAGDCGFLFEAGNDNSLMQVLARLKNIDREAFAKKLAAHVNKELSFSSIGVKLTELAEQLCSK